MQNNTPGATPPHSPILSWSDAGLDELLALASSRYSLHFEPVSAGGVTLQILQIADMKERLDKAIMQNALKDALHTLPLWAKIWPASIILGHMLSHVPSKTHSILEVGAGCGLAGLVAAALGLGRVCISDINEDALLFARINILKNGLQHAAEVKYVDVRESGPEERYSLILGAEILYMDELYRPLVKFFKRHLGTPKMLGNTPPGSGKGSMVAMNATDTMDAKSAMDEDFRPQVLLASDHRRKTAPFLKKAEKEFQIDQKQIGIREKDPAEQDGHAEKHLIHIYRLTPRSRSMA